MNDKIKHLRMEYAHATLLEGELEMNPFFQFRKWFEEALEAELPEPHAMNIASVAANGRPSSRIVLLRNFDENGFVFFTNYKSKKSTEMEKTGFVALNFFWQQIERQVRIEGKIERISAADSDAYFNSRPRESQLGAWASQQSETLTSRNELEKQVTLFTRKFENEVIPRPEHWGGFRIVPDYFEFWQGRPSRLHDRIAFKIKGGGSWEVLRLNP